jgi:GH35 family endo-1,4-beta-xylanase
VGEVAGWANAFKWARAEDSDVKLFHNDYGIEG